MKRILQCYLLLSKMVIEIVNFPINSMVIFHSHGAVDQAG